MTNIPIIVAGSGRSGTTWVLDAIAKANNLRTIFEPLHPIGVIWAKPFANKYVRDDAEEPELKLSMDKVFSGRFRSLWANCRIRPDRLRLQAGSLSHKLCFLRYWYKRLITHYIRYHKVKSDRIIVKFIRANLMLGWLSNNYESKILLILRHPGAVVASKMRLGGPDWQVDVLKQYCHDKQLMEDHLSRLKNLLTRPLSPVASHTAIWCIENALAIDCVKKYGHCTVFYENLVLYADSEWERIIRSLDLKHVPDNDMLIRPSQQTSKDTKRQAFDHNHVSRWMKSFSKQQLGEIDAILKTFEICIYSAFDSMPVERVHPKGNICSCPEVL
jgi:hypothetical protein